MNRIAPVAIDLLAVLVFAVVGRASHGRGLSLTGIADTFWPFAIALLVGWLVVTLLGWEGTKPRETAIIWLVTLAGGMALRTLADDSVQGSFVVVAGAFLALFFGGWRLVAWLLRRRRT
ncbi:MAG TPA: DUF3054 domain-containing protein [Arachnia sp.]|nr:DUF3054 domain-containing protein [Arachnia sp.]HMT85285.1 DUF3054 domain-containing protein [Arachnia sp.]